MPNPVNVNVGSLIDTEYTESKIGESFLQNSQKENDQEEPKEYLTPAEKYKSTFSTRLYAFGMLALLLSIQISNQWQRFFISSAYYFNADNKDDPSHYNMGDAIPGFTPAAYSLIQGPVFNTAFSIMVFFTGSFADAYCRKHILSTAAMTWSLTSIGTAFCQRFWQVSVCRFGLGAFEAFTAPCAYSLISDFFPPERRTFANSIYALGISVGAAISQFSLLLIGLVGWRRAYFTVGSYGLTCGFLLLILMTEPKRGQYELTNIQEQESEQKDQEEKEETQEEEVKLTLVQRYKMAFRYVLKEPTIRYVLIGGSLRMWAGQIIQYFSISYFNPTFERQLLYPTLSALSILIGGGLSNLIAGQISDKFEARNYRTKSYVTACMSLMCSPLCVLCFMIQSSFYFSMSMFFLIYLLSEGWMGPSLAMLQQVVPVEFKAIIVATFFCCITLSGTLASILVGEWIGKFDNIGLLLTLNTALPALLATFSFYCAGKPYAKFMNKKHNDAGNDQQSKISQNAEQDDDMSYLPKIEEFEANQMDII